MAEQLITQVQRPDESHRGGPPRGGKSSRSGYGRGGGNHVHYASESPHPATRPPGYARAYSYGRNSGNVSAIPAPGSSPPPVYGGEEEEVEEVGSSGFCCCGGSGGKTREVKEEGGGDPDLLPHNGGGGGGGGGAGGGGGGGTQMTLFAQAGGGGTVVEAENGGYGLLGPMMPGDVGRKTLVLDLDETLVHSSFRPTNNSSFIVPVEIEGETHMVYVLVRPHCAEFLRRMGELYEVVIFTASLRKYADPVIDLLDTYKVVRYRLYRDSCVSTKGNFVKDLSTLGRDMKAILIVDNSPVSYLFDPSNAIACSSWFDDLDDTELLDLIPFLEELTHVDDVRNVLGGLYR